MKRIYFTGDGKTKKYVGGDPIIHCFLDVPESRTLTVGFNITEGQARHLLRDHGDIFVDPDVAYKGDVKITKAEPKPEPEPEPNSPIISERLAQMPTEEMMALSLPHRTIVMALASDGITVKSLKTLAKDHNIDLVGIKLKVDIAEVIATALEDEGGNSHD